MVHWPVTHIACSGCLKSHHTHDLFIYLFQHTCTLWIQRICVGTFWSLHSLVCCHILCDLIMVFMMLKEVTASIMAAHYSGLAYNDTLPLCLLLFLTGWNTVINTFVLCVSGLSCTKTQLDTPQWNNCLRLPLSVTHNTQLLRRKWYFGHWHGMASSCVCYHAGLPSCIMSCQVIKCRHN
jgi:hypothetical protein